MDAYEFALNGYACIVVPLVSIFHSVTDSGLPVLLGMLDAGLTRGISVH